VSLINSKRQLSGIHRSGDDENTGPCLRNSTEFSALRYLFYLNTVCPLLMLKRDTVRWPPQSKTYINIWCRFLLSLTFRTSGANRFCETGTKVIENDAGRPLRNLPILFTLYL